MTQMAFPAHGSMGEVVDYGMTLRDYFAAKAMNGFLCLYIAEHLEGDPDTQILAEHAYEVADAMLKAREA